MDSEKTYSYYNTAGYEKRIVELRKSKQGLKRIMKWYIEEVPVLDELVLLADILKVLNKNNLAVSRREVLNCVNVYFNKDFHIDKQGYLNWLYSSFKVKKGTIVQAGKSRDEPFQKDSGAGKLNSISALNSHDSALIFKSDTNIPPIKEMPENNTQGDTLMSDEPVILKQEVLGK